MSKRSFTLIELMVVIAIIGVLGTMVAPAVGESINKARVAKVVALAHTLETACDAYFMDTGSYPLDYGGWPGYSALLVYQNLSTNPGGVATWSGPYIKKPLQTSDNAFYPAGNSGVLVYNSLTYAGNFDLNGDGIADRSGTGNFLFIPAGSENNARRIDAIFDAGITGDWKVTGRVKYGGAWGGAYGEADIYLSGGS